MGEVAGTAIVVEGVGLDPRTRCRHYSGAKDIIAVRFACCARYYACHRCHEELAGHPAARWPVDRFDRPAILCGACRRELTVAEYLSCNHGCPFCTARFNPACSRHHHLYFQMDASP